MLSKTRLIRVLVVEDEPLIAMTVEDTIEMLGYQIIGPVAQLDEAIALVAHGEFDCAILDINIRGGNTFALADLLLGRGCPFLIATGYSDRSIPKRLVGVSRLRKPYSSADLETELRLLCARAQMNRLDR